MSELSIKILTDSEWIYFHNLLENCVTEQLSNDHFILRIDAFTRLFIRRYDLSYLHIRSLVKHLVIEYEKRLGAIALCPLYF